MNSFKLAVAQVSSVKGDVPANIATHIAAIHKAGENEVSVLVFPELSLTGYEPDLARSLAFANDDPRLDLLIQAARDSGVHVIAGAPLATEEVPQIGAIIITTVGKVFTYSKNNLTPTEKKYFSPGRSLRFLELAGEKIAIAICADANVPAHAQSCADEGASIYVAGVLFSENGYAADAEQLANYAYNHSMLVAIANHNRQTGGWIPAGRSAIWSPSGLITELNGRQNALAIAELTDSGWMGEIIEL